MTTPILFVALHSLTHTLAESPPTVIGPGAAAGSASQRDRPPARPLGPEPTAYTLRPGRFVVQADLLNVSHRREKGAHTTGLRWPIVFRAGVSDRLEVQAGIDALVWEGLTGHGSDESSAGIGDLTLGAKFNLWGNDRELEGGSTAMAAAALLTLPTARDDLGAEGIEGALVLPWESDLAEGLTLEIIPGIGFVRTGPGQRYDLDLGASLVLCAGVTEQFSVKAEFASALSTARGATWSGGLLAGATFALSEDLLIEPILGLGLGAAAGEFSFAATLVRRF